MSEVDELWSRACTGDSSAFGDWAARVEGPMRRRLSPFATHIDSESVVQEALVRMWHRATDAAIPPLEGENASLRFALVLSWNLARNMARKHGRLVTLPPDELPEPAPVPDAPPDPLLRRALEQCWQALAPKPRQAMEARLHLVAPDAKLAHSLDMTVNAFLQNIVRARRQLAACLAGKGIHVEGATL